MKSINNIHVLNTFRIEASTGNRLFHSALAQQPHCTIGKNGTPLPLLHGWSLQMAQILHAHAIFIKWRLAVRNLRARDYDVSHWSKDLKEAREKLETHISAAKLTIQNIEKQLSV